MEWCGAIVQVMGLGFVCSGRWVSFPDLSHLGVPFLRGLGFRQRSGYLGFEFISDAPMSSA